MKRHLQIALLLLSVALLGQGVMSIRMTNTPDDVTVSSHDAIVVDAGFGFGFVHDFFRWLRSLFEEPYNGGGTDADGGGTDADGGGDGCSDGGDGCDGG